MRRLEVVGKSFTFTDDIDPQYKSLSFQVQVLRGQYNFVRAEFFLEGQELATFLAGDRDYEKLAEEKMRWILELNQTPVDAYLLETMQREQREILGSVEETKTAAIEAARSEVAGVKDEAITAAQFAAGELAEETRTQAISAATEAASVAVEEVRSEAIQAAAQKVEVLLPALRKLVRIDDLTPEDIADLIALYDPWEPGQAVGVADIRSYEGKLYKVVQPHTTQADWTPDSMPALWTEIAPPETEDGEEIVPDFVQPTGAHDAYKAGDKVLFEGKIYESMINDNVWSPSDHPQGWKEVTD